MSTSLPLHFKFPYEISQESCLLYKVALPFESVREILKCE